MIEGEKYLFIHMPKCAGTHLISMLTHYYGGSSVYSSLFHNNIIPDSAKHKYRFIGRRNPWRWYVSYFKERRKILMGHNPYVNWMRENKCNIKELDFIDSTRNYNYYDDIDLFRYWYKIVHESRICPFEEPESNMIMDKGVYSTIYIYLAGMDEEKLEGTYRVEHLANDLDRIFKEAGMELNLKEKILLRCHCFIKTRPTNYKKNYKEYYTKNIIDDIYEKDEYMINRYHYEFDKDI